MVFVEHPTISAAARCEIQSVTSLACPDDAVAKLRLAEPAISAAYAAFDLLPGVDVQYGFNIGGGKKGAAVAKRIITQLVSDLSGVDISDGKGETIEFSYRGSSYSIDLADKEVASFDKAIAMYLEHATKTGGRRKSSTAGSRSGYSAKDVRAWAKAQGIDVPERGRIPVSVVEQYMAAS